ncbi:hypothetical protein [Streptoalloteichus tenebrarius]|uniref:hypothetical protein n=1 Tax=Streptoalloteichus tenebrarius (strain ATCC 17920 / DSM 40477 / JCM 4838 / CBS 697.72 / NBRC 16177 / NCIMB 11028 / NRRL B-12390 / A12253. 1 / ISP 5477) TaxID=1933 RepID=UPI0020A4828B|nr:hypothetical protein [Streptoalloteichus tenebrarius]
MLAAVAGVINLGAVVRSGGVPDLRLPGIARLTSRTLGGPGPRRPQNRGFGHSRRFGGRSLHGRGATFWTDLDGARALVAAPGVIILDGGIPDARLPGITRLTNSALSSPGPRRRQNRPRHRRCLGHSGHSRRIGSHDLCRPGTTFWTDLDTASALFFVAVPGVIILGGGVPDLRLLGIARLTNGALGSPGPRRPQNRGFGHSRRFGGHGLCCPSATFWTDLDTARALVAAPGVIILDGGVPDLRLPGIARLTNGALGSPGPRRRQNRPRHHRRLGHSGHSRRIGGHGLC